MFRHFANCFVLVSVFALNGCDDVPDLSLPNEPPVAVDDSVFLKQNQAINIGVLFNDSDIDGDVLTITITTPPSNGNAEVLIDSVAYTPDLYFTGTDEFDYQITDLVGNSATATVSVEVNRRETRAIFSTTSGSEEKLYMLDSRDPGTLVDLGQSLDAGETLVNWAISDELQQAVLLTVTDDGTNPITHRIVTVPLDDPGNPANELPIDSTGRFVDGGLLVSSLGTRAIYTFGHRHVYLIDPNDDMSETVSFDTGFAPSTLSPVFYSPVDAGYVTAGTLGAGTEERSAIYFIPLNFLPPIAILDDAAILQSTVLRLLSGNSMIWLTEDSTTAVPPAAYSCTTPPPQTLSALVFTNLGNPGTVGTPDTPGPSVDLNLASGLLGDPTNLISYHHGPAMPSALVAACPPETATDTVDIFQIIEIPFAAPASARVVATANDASDGLWNIDVGAGGNNVVYVLEGTTGLRTMAIDMTGIEPVICDRADPPGTDPVVCDLTDVPDYQTYTAGTETRIPPSVFSTDGLRWLFLAPVNDALTRLEWLQLKTVGVDTLEVSTLDLPFTASNLISDGYYALVQGETGGAGPAPVALIDLNNPQITPVDVPGVLAETLTDSLNQIESAIHLVPIP